MIASMLFTSKFFYNRIRKIEIKTNKCFCIHCLMMNYANIEGQVNISSIPMDYLNKPFAPSHAFYCKYKDPQLQFCEINGIWYTELRSV